MNSSPKSDHEGSKERLKVTWAMFGYYRVYYKPRHIGCLDTNYEY
jgi:hypothetical protein